MKYDDKAIEVVTRARSLVKYPATAPDRRREASRPRDTETMSRRVLVWVAMMVMACSESKPPRASTASTPAASEATCAAKATKLERFVRELDWPDSYAVPRQLAVTLVAAESSVARARSAPYLRSVQIGPDTLRLDDADVQLEELRFELEQEPNQRAQPRALYFLIDGQTPWERIEAVASHAYTANVREIVLVFRRKSQADPPLERPAMPEIDKVLEVESGEKASRFAAYVTKLLAPCRRLQALILPEEGPAAFYDESTVLERGAQIVATYRDDCQCKVDLAQLQATLYLMFQDIDPVSFVTVTLGPAKGATQPRGRWIDIHAERVAARTWHVRGDL